MPVSAQQLMQILEEVERSVPGLLGVYRFGSSGTPAERPDSDLDLAMLAAKPLAGRERWRLESALARIARGDVDLVDLGAASTVLRAQVVSGGERVLTLDETACEGFEITALSAYAMLNEERREILRDIEERGMVY